MTKRSVLLIVSILSAIAVISAIYLYPREINTFEDVLSKLEDTLNSNTYTVKTPYRGTYDVLQKNNDVYIASRLAKREEEEYTRYEYLVCNKNLSYRGFEEYRKGESLELNNSENELHVDLLQNTTPTIKHIFSVIEGIDDEINGDEDTLENHLLGIQALTNNYDSKDDAFHFVEQFDINNQRLLLTFHFNEYIEWCENNLENYSTIEPLSYDDAIIRYTITFDDQYINKIIKMIGSVGGNFETDSISYSTTWEFSNVNEKINDLEDYVNNPTEYFKKVLADVNEKAIERIQQSAKENPDHGYDINGLVINKGEGFTSTSSYIETYTADEIITYLSGEGQLPDKTQDWRVKYVEYIIENKNNKLSSFFANVGEYKSYIQVADINKDGTMEMIIRVEDNWGGSYSRLLYLDNSNNVCISDTSIDAKYHKNYIYYITPQGVGELPGWQETYNYIYVNENSGLYTHDFFEATLPSWADSDEDMLYLKGTTVGDDYNSTELMDISKTIYNSMKTFSNKRTIDEEFNIEKENNSVTDYETLILNYK